MGLMTTRPTASIIAVGICTEWRICSSLFGLRISKRNTDSTRIPAGFASFVTSEPLRLKKLIEAVDVRMDRAIANSIKNSGLKQSLGRRNACLRSM